MATLAGTDLRQTELQQPEENPLVALRGQVITPTTSPRVQTAAGLADTAAQRVASAGTAPGVPQLNAPAATQLPNFQAIGPGNPLVQAFGGPSAATTNLTNLSVGAAEGLAGLPDRTALAQRAFDLISERSDPAFQRSLDRAVSLNAAAGRLGSGLVTRDLADITQARSRDLSQAQESLALQSAAQTLQDRLGTLAGLSGLQGQLSGQDLATAGQRLRTELAQSGELAGLRGEARGERGAELQQLLAQHGINLDTFGAELSAADLGLRGRQADIGNQLDILGALSGREQLLRGTELGEREELRGERARADSLAELANQRRIQQTQMEAALQNQLFNQLFSRASLSGELGFNGTNILDALQPFVGEAGRQGTENINTGRQALMNAFLRFLNLNNNPTGGTPPLGGAQPIPDVPGVPYPTQQPDRPPIEF